MRNSRGLLGLVPLLLFALLAAPTRAVAQSETIEYYGTDAVGSVRIVFNASGTVLGRQDYDPFGREILAAWGVSPERFGGQTADGEVQQSYFHARQFQGRTGRFATTDALFGAESNPQGWNRYSYSLNNPETLSDFSGLFPNIGTEIGLGIACGLTPNHFCSFDTEKYIGDLFAPPPSDWLFFDPRPGRIGGGAGARPGTGGTGTTPPSGPPSDPPPPVPPPDPCSPGSTSTTIVSANWTTSAPTTTLGAIIGEVGGPIGSLAGGLLGSLFGVGVTGSYVPSTRSACVGLTAVFAPSYGGGNGTSANVVYVPAGQNPNAIANGRSSSVTFQPQFATRRNRY